MKSTFKFLIALVAVASLTIGCSGDDAAFKHPANTVDPDGIIDPVSVGYLSLKGLVATVEVETEDFKNKENASDLGTRTSDGDVTPDNDETIDVSDYIVTIVKEATGEVVYKDSYAECLALTTPLELYAGAYNLSVYSCEESEIQAVGWDCPAYGGKARYVVGDEKITSAGEIVCTLLSVKTTVDMSIDLVDLFEQTPDDEADKLQVIVEVGANELVYDPFLPGAQEGYFEPSANETMRIYLTGMYNVTPDDEEPTYLRINKGDWMQEIKGVKAGQYRNIFIKIDYNSEGAIQAGVTITTWAYDEEIDVDITGGDLTEDTVFDPDSEITDKNSPVLSLGNDLDILESYIINSSIFDFDTDTYSPIYKVNVTPESGSVVAQLKLIVSSTNEELMSKLYELGFDENGSMMIYNEGSVMSDTMVDFISLREEEDVIVAAVKYDGMMSLSKYIGDHTVKVVAIDSRNRGSYTSLLFKVLASDAGPKVEWAGYDFDTQYEVFTEGEGENPDVNLVISTEAEGGITALSVIIDSEVLSEELLQTVGLTTNMDLVNAEGELYDQIAKLGLPLGDQVKGQSEVVVNINDFLPLLAGQGAGNSDFTISVGDATGTTIKKIQLIKK